LDSAGSSSAAKIAMTAITTSNSVKVNPFVFPLFMAPVCLLENARWSNWNQTACLAHKTRDVSKFNAVFLIIQSCEIQPKSGSSKKKPRR
jgi:hypothetical protein